MFRMSLTLSACLITILPALAGAQNPIDARSARPASGGAAASPARPTEEMACERWAADQEPDDPRWRWRLRAYRHLDCVVSLVDQALRGAPGGTAAAGSSTPAGGTVSVSRDDLERIRTLAWWARDAAARIGQ